MANHPGPVTAEDAASAIDAAIGALTPRIDLDWHVPAGSLDWDCWETVEHIADALLFYATQLVPARGDLGTGYPFDFRTRRPGGLESFVFAREDQGNAGLLRVLNTCGGLLVGMLRTAPPSLRAHHTWGRSDPEGFAAMGVVETLVHVNDTSRALGITWEPDAGLCTRALFRLFPDVPQEEPAWDTMLWATGRESLGYRPRRREWRWFAEPRR